MTDRLPLASLSFLVVYGIAFLLDIPVVYYFPLLNEVTISLQSPTVDTPVMRWYGYLSLGILAAMLALVPGLFGVRPPPSLRAGWYLYLPASLLILVIVKESHWFLK